MIDGNGLTPAGLFGGETAGVDREGRSDQQVEESDLTLDQIFEVLKNPRRRNVLRYLREVDDEVTLGDLSEQIAAWENGEEVQQITSSERKRVYVSLYQVHLPKMDEMDTIAFDKSRGTIGPGENVGLLYRYLDPPESGRDWSRSYVGVAGATIVALLVAMVVESMVAVPAVSVVAGAALVAFATLALLHYRVERTTGPGSARTDQFGVPTRSET